MWSSPLIPSIAIDVGNAMSAQLAVQHMYSSGMLVSGMCYPNAPEGSAYIRMNLSAGHSEDQVDQLVSELETAMAKAI